MPRKGMDYKIFRKWALFLGGLVGFSVVLIADLFTDKEVNYAIYVLLAGMMGLDSVLTRQEEHEEDIEKETRKDTVIPDVDVHRKDDPS